MTQLPSIIYQAGKLGDLPRSAQDLALARRLDDKGVTPGRIYGNSGGCLAALAHGIVLAAPACTRTASPPRPPAPWTTSPTFFHARQRSDPPRQLARPAIRLLQSAAPARLAPRPA